MEVKDKDEKKIGRKSEIDILLKIHNKDVGNGALTTTSLMLKRAQRKERANWKYKRIGRERERKWGSVQPFNFLFSIITSVEPSLHFRKRLKECWNNNEINNEIFLLISIERHNIIGIKRKEKESMKQQPFCWMTLTVWNKPQEWT